MGITLSFVCLGKCTMNYFSGADMLSVIGGLAFLSFLSFRIIITARTQHTLSAGLVHLDKMPATKTFSKAASLNLSESIKN